LDGYDKFDKETQADYAGIRTTAVALASLYKTEHEANEQWLKNTGVDVKESKARKDKALRTNAYYSGVEHGKTVSLNQQVGATATPKRTAIK
jgi:hypothetical protein